MAGTDSLQYTGRDANYKKRSASARTGLYETKAASGRRLVVHLDPEEDGIARGDVWWARKKRKAPCPQEAFHFLKACCNLNGSC